MISTTKMKLNNILYRIRQKVRYHTSRDPVQKKIAEINRFRSVVIDFDNDFTIEGCGLNFKKSQHSFVLSNFSLFVSLLKQPNLSFEIQDDYLICRTENLILPVTTPEELFIINEIWVEGCYNVNLKTSKNVVVIDVGMNVGYTALFFASQNSVHKVYSFEPFTPTYKQGLINIEYNPQVFPKLKTHNFGLSKASMSLEVDYSPNHRGRIGIWGTELILEEIEHKSKEKLTLHSFNEEIKRIIENHLDCDLILKIDCEGSEYDIFEEVDIKLFDNVRCVLIEWHKFGPNALTKKLNEAKFSILSFNPHGKKTGMLYAFK